MSDPFDDFLNELEGEEGDEEEAKPVTRKKKASKKKAAAKPAEPVQEEAEEVEVVEEAPEPEDKPATKKRGPKPGAKRKPPAPKAAPTNGVLGELEQELGSIGEAINSTAHVDALKAELRTAKKLDTQLTRFAKKVVAAAKTNQERVKAIESELDA